MKEHDRETAKHGNTSHGDNVDEDAEDDDE